MKKDDAERAAYAEKMVAEHLRQVKVSLSAITRWQKRATYYRKKIHAADKAALLRVGNRRIDLE